MEPINFYTFKWGNKYSADYVNKLYSSLAIHCHVDYTFTCITDDSTGIDSSINIIDYDSFDPFPYPKDRVFTREKLVLMKRFNKGKNFWLDLDLLIMNDITDLVTRELEKPTFIWNYWTWDRGEDDHNRLWSWGKGTICYMNSSFVGWQDDRGEFLYDHLDKWHKEAFHTYASLDKYLFYQHWNLNKGKLHFWERGVVSRYEGQDDPTLNRMWIFNSSHIKGNYQNKIYNELHEQDGWVGEAWQRL